MSGINELPIDLVEEWDAHINKVKKDTGKWLTLADQDRFVRDWFDTKERAALQNTDFAGAFAYTTPVWYIPQEQRSMKYNMHTKQLETIKPQTIIPKEG